MHECTLSALSVGYEGRALIRDIDVRLRCGEILALIGPNGGGKSTILKTIARQLAPIAGTVCIGHDDVHAMRPAELARRLSAVLTGRVRPELMTCYDVAAAGRYPHTGALGVLSARDHGIVRRCLAQVSALDIAQRPFDRVSDGQRQRVLLARALCQEPEVIVLDEPTSYLDIRYKTELLSILQRMAREQGITVILSLHEIDLAQKIADQVLCVHGERAACVGTPEEVFTPGRIEALYGLAPGSYDARSGSAELAPPEGAPRVFVVAGAGYGSAHFRRLQKRGIPFDAGILFDNDVDYPVARALARRVFVQQAFEPVAANVYEEALACALACGAVLDTGVPIRAGNERCGALLADARAHGVRIVRDADELH